MAIAEAIKKGPTYVDWIAGDSTFMEAWRGAHLRRDGQERRVLDDDWTIGRADLTERPQFAGFAVPAAK